MKQTTFKETYPLFTLDIPKEECKFDKVPEILDFLEGLVEAHPKAVNIARFNHFAHTKNINGDIAEDILDAQNLILCFGMHLPAAAAVGVRPRSIGVTEYAKYFVVNFMAAPNPIANEAMESWVKQLIK